MSDEPKNHWERLSEDIQEKILLRLPVSTAIRCASVCKRWRSLIFSRSFSAQWDLLPSKPWFCLWGINELIHTRSAVYTFDPALGRWLRIPTVRPPDFNRASLSGCHGLFFAFSGSKVCFALNPTKMSWKATSAAAATSTRCYSLVGAIGDPASASGFSLVVVGGGVLDGGDQRSVELYRSASRSWEPCPPLPAAGFRDSVSCHWMSSAALGRRLYVADYYGDVASFDTDTMSWSQVCSLPVPNLVSLFMLACNARLHAAVVCRRPPTRSGECLRVLVADDEVAMDWHEVSVMPQELFSRFNADEHKQASLKCVGFGTGFYVYSECVYIGYPVCMCDVSEGKYVWKQLPSLPSPPRFDRVICASMDVTPRACLDCSMFN